MNKIDVLSLAIKSKLVLPRANCVDGAHAFSDDDLQGALYEFARLVEQATLERAAKHFDDRGKDKHGNWSTGSYDADSPGIILRALKTKGE